MTYIIYARRLIAFLEGSQRIKNWKLVKREQKIRQIKILVVKTFLNKQVTWIECNLCDMLIEFNTKTIDMWLHFDKVDILCSSCSLCLPIVIRNNFVHKILALIL